MFCYCTKIAKLTLNGFYPNVTTWRSGLCYRKSVRLSVRPYWRCSSLVYLLFRFVSTLFCVNKDVYITFVRPTQEVETFGNISSIFCTLALLWPTCTILRRSSQGNPSFGGVKRKMGRKIERCHVPVGRSGLVVSASDCGVRGPRFESYRGRLWLSRKPLRYTTLGTGCAPLLQCLGRLSLLPSVGR